MKPPVVHQPVQPPVPAGSTSPTPPHTEPSPPLPLNPSTVIAPEDKGSAGADERTGP
jgi:hypothetical protein